MTSGYAHLAVNFLLLLEKVLMACVQKVADSSPADLQLPCAGRSHGDNSESD
ncbi:hypothetical protein ACLBOM_24735 [Escherichia coli]